MSTPVGQLDYYVTRRSRWIRTDEPRILIVQLVVSYLAFSAASLPWVNSVWWGEVPILVLPQLLKIYAASWLRNEFLLRVFDLCGLSATAYNDRLLARPIALALVYIAVVVPLLSVLRCYRREQRYPTAWVIALIALAVVDFLVTLHFSAKPRLSFY